MLPYLIFKGSQSTRQKLTSVATARLIFCMIILPKGLLRVTAFPLNNSKARVQMQKKTRSLLEELNSIYDQRHAERDRRYIIESRASNVIASAVRLVEEIEQHYTPDQADNLIRKLLNAIRTKDAGKFTRSVRRTDADI